MTPQTSESSPSQNPGEHPSAVGSLEESQYVHFEDRLSTSFNFWALQTSQSYLFVPLYFPYAPSLLIYAFYFSTAKASVIRRVQICGNRSHAISLRFLYIPSLIFWRKINPTHRNLLVRPALFPWKHCRMRSFPASTFLKVDQTWKWHPHSCWIVRHAWISIYSPVAGPLSNFASNARHQLVTIAMSFQNVNDFFKSILKVLFWDLILEMSVRICRSRQNFKSA